MVIEFNFQVMLATFQEPHRFVWRRATISYDRESTLQASQHILSDSVNCREILVCDFAQLLRSRTLACRFLLCIPNFMISSSWETLPGCGFNFSCWPVISLLVKCYGKHLIPSTINVLNVVLSMYLFRVATRLTFFIVWKLYVDSELVRDQRLHSSGQSLRVSADYTVFLKEGPSKVPVKPWRSVYGLNPKGKKVFHSHVLSGVRRTEMQAMPYPSSSHS